MKKCDYGCGHRAQFVFNNGKKCCSASSNACPHRRLINKKSHVRSTLLLCKFCKRETLSTSGNTRHQKHCHANPDRVPNNATFGMLGKSHSTESKLLISAKSTGTARTAEREELRKARISRAMKSNGAGGYREGSGRGKKGIYKGIYCDSSWELAFVLWCELKGRSVKRARKRFKYVFEGREREYLPDFRYKTSQGEWKYLEIKGFKSEQWLAKKKAFPHELLVIGKRVISEQILPLVIKVYGKDFIRVYE